MEKPAGSTEGPSGAGGLRSADEDIAAMQGVATALTGTANLHSVPKQSSSASTPSGDGSSAASAVIALDADEDSILVQAAGEGSLELVSDILDQSPGRIKVEGEGIKALHSAIIEEHPDIVLLLLQRGVPLNQAVMMGALTPLHSACSTGNAEIVELLTSHGADVAAKPKGISSQTPLHVGAAFGSAGVVKALLGAGADAAARDDNGRTPLHMAASKGHYGACKTLLEASAAELEAVDSDGMTPAAIAAHNAHTRVAEMLAKRQRGEDDAEGERDESAAMLARLQAQMAEDEARLRSQGDAIMDMLKRIAVENGLSPEETDGLFAGGGAGGHDADDDDDDDEDDDDIPISFNSIGGGGASGGAGGAGAASSAVPAEPAEAPSALAEAAKKGSLKEVTEILARSPELVNEESHGVAALHAAVGKGYLDIASELLLRGASANHISESMGCSPLFTACMLGKVSMLELLVQHGADVKQRLPSDGTTPLHRAASFAPADAVRYLLKAGADCGARDEDGKTPLLDAIASKRTETVAALLEHSTAELEVRDAAGDTPLRAAVYRGHAEIAKLLLDHGASPNSRSGDAKSSETPLHCAVSQKRLAIAELLLNSGAEIDARDGLDYTALTNAARWGDPKMCSLLLSKGADPNLALPVAATFGCMDTAPLLLEAGADPSRIDRATGLGPLERACSEGKGDMCKLLLRYGARPINDSWDQRLCVLLKPQLDGLFDHAGPAIEANLGFLRWVISSPAVAAYAATLGNGGGAGGGATSSPSMFRLPGLDRARRLLSLQNNAWDKRCLLVTAFHRRRQRFKQLRLAAEKAEQGLDDKTENAGQLVHSASAGDVDVIAALLETEGYDVNAADENGTTPLFAACKKGHETAVRLLIDRGADPSKPDDRGNTSLHVAARKGFHLLCTVLLEAGAAVDARNQEELTPLLIACEEGHLEVARVLLSYEADPDAEDSNGVSCLEHACRRGDARISALLLESGAARLAALEPILARLLPAPTPAASAPLEPVGSAAAALPVPAASDDAPHTDAGGETGASGAAPDPIPAPKPAIKRSDVKALVIAAEEGDVDAVKAIIARAGSAIVNEANREKKTALRAAMAKQRVPVVKELLEHGATMEHSIMSEVKDVALADALLKKGANPLWTTVNRLQTPVHSRAIDGNAGVLALLLDTDVRKEDPPTVERCALQDHQGMTPLMLAIENGHLEACKLLLERSQIEANTANLGRQTPLGLASALGHVEIVTLLLSKGAEISATNLDTETTALHLAAGNKDAGAVVTTLLQAGADPRATDNRDRTALHDAARSGNTTAAEELLRVSPGLIFARDNAGNGPLEEAYSGGQRAMILLLPRYGARLSDAAAASAEQARLAAIYRALDNGDECSVADTLSIINVAVERGVAPAEPTSTVPVEALLAPALPTPEEALALACQRLPSFLEPGQEASAAFEALLRLLVRRQTDLLLCLGAAQSLVSCLYAVMALREAASAQDPAFAAAFPALLKLSAAIQAAAAKPQASAAKSSGAPAGPSSGGGGGRGGGGNGPPVQPPAPAAPGAGAAARQVLSPLDAWTYYQALLWDFRKEENPQGDSLGPYLAPSPDARELSAKVAARATAEKALRDGPAPPDPGPKLTWTFCCPGPSCLPKTRRRKNTQRGIPAAMGDSSAVPATAAAAPTVP